MPTKAQVEAAVKKHGGNQQAAAKDLGIARSTLQHHLKAKVPQRANGIGKSLADFRETHDKAYIIPKRITEALKQLGDGWEYEVGFARLAGISLTDLSVYRDQFADFIVIVSRDGRRAWAGSKEVAERMREMIR